MGVSAAIYGLAGLELTAAERDFFRDADPWGFILFARNIDNPDQVRALTASLRDVVGRDAPVLIDQEGGRVQRMRAPFWAEWPPMRDLAEDPMDEIARMDRIRAQYTAIADELRDVGVDVNCAPVLDVPQPNAHPIIGDRAFGSAPADIALRARECMAALLEGGVLPVIKHLPGHGRALADSHEALPRVNASMEDLRACDFLPFLSLRDAPLGMTAHIVYEAIDPESCATLSAPAIRLIREELGFDGLLMTDDLSMHALEGPYYARASRALAAGCDVVLHCNGDLTEMTEVAAGAGGLTGVAARRADRALSLRKPRGEVQQLREVVNG
ncbi:MAG: beta-N-acetylhexosaminidase [Pseudomonadota bacterium]